MRPAQKAPENPVGARLFWSAAGRFNEAGAKSAGKLYRDTDTGVSVILLQ